MAVTDWNTDPNANTTVGGINIAENCPAGNINGAIREMMAEIKDFSDDLPDTLQPLSAKLTALSNLTLAADQLIYATGASALATSPLSAFMRTLLDDPDQATALQTLGAVKIASLSLGQPGHLRLQVGVSSFFQIAWGFTTVGPNSSGSANYSNAFSAFSIPVTSAMALNGVGADDENCGFVNGSATTTGFLIYNANNAGFSIPWIAVGV